MNDPQLLKEMRAFASMTLKEKYTQSLNAVSANFKKICVLTFLIFMLYFLQPIIYKVILGSIFMLFKMAIGAQGTIQTFNTIDIILRSVAFMSSIFVVSIPLVGLCTSFLLYVMDDEPDLDIGETLASGLSELLKRQFLLFWTCMLPLASLCCIILLIYFPPTLIPVLGGIIKVGGFPFIFIYFMCFIFYLADDKEATTQAAIVNTFRIISVNLSGWALATILSFLMLPMIFAEARTFWPWWISILTFDILYIVPSTVFLGVYFSCLLCYMAITYHQSSVRLLLVDTEGSWEE